MPRIIRVVIIGGGISGIAQAIRLKEALGDHLALTILERQGSPGGVWRDAKWAGAGVDVPIHLYSLGSDLKPDWPDKYAAQPDVLAYWESLIDRHGLRDAFLFNTEYVGSTWSAETQTHDVQITNTKTGVKSALEAEVLISATGPLAKPLIPELPGRESFEGNQFHNLRWDPKVQLAGKRVAVVGNGSSGVQLVPGVSELPGVTLTHYIRSGGYFIPKIQHTYSSFEKFLFRWLPGWIQLNRFNLLQEHDRMWSIKTFGNDPGREAFEKDLLEYLREKAPAEYLEALTPHYPLGAKRPAFDYGWLDSLHRDNVTLVNTDLASVKPNGIVTADGKLREHDVIIWATGSDVPHHGLGENVNLHGEDGKELQAYWKEVGGPEAYAGLAVPGFPNYFTVIGPNGTAGSWGWTLGRQTYAIARIVRELVDYDLSSVQPSVEAYKRDTAQTQELLKNCVARTDKAHNWWRVEEGKKVTVVSPKTGKQLWWSTLSTPWADWEAVRIKKDKDGKSRAENVNVAAIRTRRRLFKALLAGGAVAVIGYWAPLPEVWESAAAQVGQVKEWLK